MTTHIVHRKTPFVLQDKTDNTKQVTLDLSNLSAPRELTIPNESGNVIVRTSNRDQYRFFGGKTSGETTSSGWYLIDYQTTGFIGAADPSNAWNSTTKGYIVPVTGFYSISHNVALGSIGGSDFVRGESGILVGETSGTNNTFFTGERIYSQSSRDFINCGVKSILLNAGDSIRSYVRSSHNRELLGLTAGGGPNDGNTLYNYMSIRFLGTT